jgi:hypothetical protein
MSNNKKGNNLSQPTAALPFSSSISKPKRLKFKFVVIIDKSLDNSGRPLNLVTALKLDDKRHFPESTLIDTEQQRQVWRKGQMVNINWPEENNDELNIVQVTVHDLCK